MPVLIGNAPNQVPTNGDLGDLAFQNANAVKSLNVETQTVTTQTAGTQTVGTQAVTTQTVGTQAVTTQTVGTNTVTTQTVTNPQIDTQVSEIRPSLLLDFAKSKTLDPRIVFARGSTGTFFDANGVLQTASSNVARITHDPVTGECLGLLVEPQATNLILASQDFAQQNRFTSSNAFDDAAWSKTRLTVAGSQSDPFGGSTAFKLQEDTSANSHLLTQVASTVNGVPHIVSVYAKAVERNWIAISFSSSSLTIGYFDLQNGVVGTAGGTSPPTNMTITSVGNGWYRCSYTGIAGASTTSISILTASANNTVSYQGVSNNGILIYGAQVEVNYGTTPSAYYATTSATFAPWVPTRASFVANATTSPDGTSNALKLVEDATASANHLVQQTYIPLGNTTYTYSVYLKKAERIYANIQIGTFGSQVASNTIYVNLETGTIVSATDPSRTTMTSVGNGWYRVSSTVTTIASPTNIAPAIYMSSNGTNTVYTGDGSSGIFVWGAQLEATGSATTYIRTTTATATRSADSAYLSSGTWLNQLEGTIFVDRKLRALTNNQTLFSLDNGTIDVEARTVVGTNSVNLLTNTEQLDSSSWSKLRATVTPNVTATTAPDGTNTADKLVEDTTASNSHGISASSVSASSAVTYTFSIYLKAAERTLAYVRMHNVSTGPFGTTTPAVSVNLSNGTLGTAVGTSTNSITSVGNGWYRISMTATTTSAGAINGQIFPILIDNIISYTGDGTSGIYAWGAQYEAASSASTYEPNPIARTSYEVGSDGLIQTANFASIDQPNFASKVTFAYKANDMTFYRGGVSAGTDTSVTLPTAMNRLVIGGSLLSSGREINGTISKIAYFPKRIANAELQEMTS